MKSAKRKIKEGKVHKKARVARFITNNFYFWYANKVIDVPNLNPQPIRQPISHRPVISKQQSQINKKDTSLTHQNENTITRMASQNSDHHVNNNTYNDTNSINDNILEVETINKPLPECISEVIPKSFDIIQRGPLPSIVFHNNKVKIIEP